MDVVSPEPSASRPPPANSLCAAIKQMGFSWQKLSRRRREFVHRYLALSEVICNCRETIKQHSHTNTQNSFCGENYLLVQMRGGGEEGAKNVVFHFMQHLQGFQTCGRSLGWSEDRSRHTEAGISRKWMCSVTQFVTKGFILIGLDLLHCL